MLLDHIKGKRTVGVYALGLDDTSKWICLDVDIEKGYEHLDDIDEHARLTTTRLVKAIYEHSAKIPLLVEKSGSRGYHIWLFSEPLNGRSARAIGMYFASLVVPPDYISVEVYPKQAKIDNAGSLVKLPLGRHQKTGNWCPLIDRNFEPIQQPWEKLEQLVPWPAAWWEKFMEVNDITPFEEMRINSEPISSGLPCITNMLEQGAKTGQRDEAAYTLANYLVKHGIPLDMTMTLLEEWNLRNEKPLTTETLRIKVESAARGTYSYFPCQRQQLDSFCDPTCRFYESKMKTRGLR